LLETGGHPYAESPLQLRKSFENLGRQISEKNDERRAIVRGDEII
jgi:hypothetical protein